MYLFKDAWIRYGYGFEEDIFVSNFYLKRKIVSRFKFKQD